MTRAVWIVAATILATACGEPASSAHPGPSPAQIGSPRWPQVQAAWSGPCKRYAPAGSIRTA